MRLGDDVDWLGGHCANHEAPEFSLRGSWMLCTPSLLQETIQNTHNYQCIVKKMSTVPLYVPLTRTGHAVPFPWVYPSRVKDSICRMVFIILHYTSRRNVLHFNVWWEGSKRKDIWGREGVQSRHAPHKMTSGPSWYTESPPSLAKLSPCLLLRLQTFALWSSLAVSIFIYLSWT